MTCILNSFHLSQRSMVELLSGLEYLDDYLQQFLSGLEYLQYYLQEL